MKLIETTMFIQDQLKAVYFMLPQVPAVGENVWHNDRSYVVDWVRWVTTSVEPDEIAFDALPGRFMVVEIHVVPT